ncbi:MULTISPECIES: FbpB family small basic protein [Paraliobacillus]|nr:MULTISPECIES: FbpB family small basic protein [Paraliobacillus]
MVRAKKLSFQTLVAENRKEIMQDEKTIEKITDRIEDKIHATIKTNISS